MKTFRIGLTICLAALLVFPTLALAKPEVAISLTAEQEIVVIEEGKEVIKIVPAEEIAPGQTIIYTLSYTNTGDEAATNVMVNNPIPEGTGYVTGSAVNQGAEVSFSIDAGKSYKQPALLTYELKKEDGTIEKRTASPEEYTHIRWRIMKIAAGESDKLSYRVRVK